MTYASGQLIQASDYNGFVANNASNVNAWWGTGSGNAGWGQTALSTVAVGDTITAASWASLINTIKAGANHTGTAVTNRTAPSAGNTITVFPNVNTDIGSVNTNRGNAVASGSTNGTWTGTASVTFPIGSGNENWAITWTNTVTFGSSDQARYFFNAGGLVRIQMGKSSTGTTKDTFWNSLVGAVGSIFVSGGIGASQSISGTDYTGVTVLGSSGSYTSNTSAGWYYLLANGSTQIYQKTQTSSPYTSDTITVTAAASGATLTITTVWNSPGLSGQPNNSVSGGTATNSPFTSFGSAPAVVINTVYPSSTYLTNSWSTNAIAESVSVATSPGPAPAAAEFLVIGGGGGGGSQGGGGGGGMTYRSSLTLPVLDQSYPVVIGSGGAASLGSPTTASYGSPPGTITVYTGAATAGSAGSTTSINANGTVVQAYGGGAGGSVNTNPAALIGSAGGPPIFNGSTAVAGAVGTGGTTYYASSATGTYYRGGANQGAGGGGGGAGSAGTASITPNVQVGGDGFEFWTGYGFAAGGGAGGYSSLGGNPFPSSGTYGGSSNKSWAGGRAGVLAGDRSSGVYAGGYVNAGSGAANSGSGGGGAAYGEVIYGLGAGTLGGNGGSGAVVIRYPGASSILQYSGQWTTNITGGYVYHLLTTAGNLYSASAPTLNIEYIVVGGGGGGGRAGLSYGGGGGGAGGVITGASTLFPGSTAITVGAGGTYGFGGSSNIYYRGGTGSNSDIAGTFVAYGGGGGGSTQQFSVDPAYIGGSTGGSGGGGAGYDGGAGTGASGVSGQGNSGANGIADSRGGGGGGAGEAATGINGGNGILCFDTNTYGGGGGGNNGSPTPGSPNGLGGTGGGGNAGGNNNASVYGGVNTGGGGGGGYIGGNYGNPGGSGGSGRVVIRYLGVPAATGGTITQSGGYTYHTFTSSGTLTTNSIPSGTVVTANTWSAGSTGPLPANQHYNWSSPYTAIWFGTHPSVGNTVYFPFIPSVTREYWWLARVDDSATAYISTAVSTSTDPTGISYTTVGTVPGWTNNTFYSLGTLEATRLYWLKVVISDAGSNYGYWHFITSSTTLTPSGKSTAWPPVDIVTTCNGNGTTYTNGYPTYTAP